MSKAKKSRDKKYKNRLHQTLTVPLVKLDYATLTSQFHKSVRSQKRQLNITNGDPYVLPSDWGPPRG
jgi:hypothetical protein